MVRAPYSTFSQSSGRHARLLFFFFFIAVFFYCSASAESAEPVDDEITVTADHLSQNAKTGISTAEGNVVIKRAGMTLFGDRAEINNNERTGIVEGNVKLVTPQAEIEASRVSLNLDTTFGTMYDVKGKTSDGKYFTGKKVRKVEKTRYLIDDGTFTSCELLNPDWLFKSSHTNLKLESLAWFTHVRFKFYGVPVFYSPIWAAPTVTKRTTGLLAPSFGISTLNGTYIGNSFFWAKSESDDVTVYHDYMDLRGHRAGLEYRYAFAEKTRGQANYNYIDDDKLGKPLWNLKYNHRQKFKNGMDSRARLDFESETSYSKEFNNELDLFSMRYTDSYVNLTDNRPGMAVSLLGRDQRSVESQRKETFDQQPELKLTMMPREIFGTRFLADMPLTLTSFRSQVSDSGSESDVITNRLAVRPTLSLSFSPVSSLNVRPFISGRYTYYSRGKTGEEAVTTEYYTAGVTVEGPRLYRLFKGKSRAVKHVITPTLGYNYVPGSSLDWDDRLNAPQIDSLDASSPTSLLTFSLLQRLLTKKIDDGSARQIVYFNATQSYDFRKAGRELTFAGDKRKPLSNLVLDLDTAPFGWIVANANASYNHYESDYDTLSFELGLKWGNIAYLSYDKRYTREPKSVFQSGLLGLNLSSKLTVEASAIYDEVNSEFTNHLIDVSYNSCCWGMSLTAQGRKRVEALEGGEIRQDYEIRYFLMLTFKGMGEQGQKPPPLVGRKL